MNSSKESTVYEVVGWTMNKNRFRWPVTPLAMDENMIIGSKYRFTILTNQLIRMEYSENNMFEDRASQRVFHRDFPACKFEHVIQDGVLTIDTGSLILIYKENQPFSRHTLCVQLKCEPGTVWYYGDDFDTFDGTARTLDQINGELPLGKSVCSRNGFSVIDDTDSAALGSDGWVESRTPNTKDIYFFGYGFEYLEAVKALYKLTGIPPMLPAYALGNWWSRCYRYTQEEYVELVNNFKAEDIPITVAVIDFDWHLRSVPEVCKDKNDLPEMYGAWGGYTWNKELFPDYKEFLRYLHENNLKVTLNLHPAEGVCCHEELYETMAEAMGIDASTRKRIPFDILSQKYMENYFDVLHHPYEEDGVDFWWVDWQQGTNYWWLNHKYFGREKSELEFVDPLWMLNHLHYMDNNRGDKRPMIFSRYSGVGSQRYAVGFSGDTYPTWKSLDFQPYFTASATNIGYTCWSHDIGGFGRGYFNSDLYVRWMQLGVFSPINRMHCSMTGGQFLGKEPWKHEEPYRSILKGLLHLRHELFPYIYTMNYRCHSELEPLIQPMYYLFPKKNAAYEVRNQYMFGSQLMVCPITQPTNDIAKVGSVKVWLPKGDWFDFFNGLHYLCENDRRMDISRSIDRYPVFAKSGAIIPMYDHVEGVNTFEPAEKVSVVVFPGSSNRFDMYEDAGDGKEFENGQYAETEFELSWGEKTAFCIHSPKGDLSLLPEKRTWTIKFRGFYRDITLKAYVNGMETKVYPVFNVSELTTSVVVEAGIYDEVLIIIEGNELITDNETVDEIIYQLINRSKLALLTKKGYFDGICRSKNDLRAMRTHVFGGAASFDEQYLYDAIYEMLTLTKLEKSEDNSYLT